MKKIVLKSTGGARSVNAARQDDRRGGSMPDELKRRMSDLLAEEFSKVGESLYDKSMADITEVIKTNFNAGLSELAKVITKKLGEIGYKESIRHVRPWLESLIADMRVKGMPSLSSALDNISSEFSVKYQEGGGEQVPEESAESLLEVEVPEVKPEEVEEVAAPAAEGTESTADELTSILEGKGAQPAAAPEEVKQKAAASTLGEVRRRLQTTRRARKVAASSPSHGDLLRSAAKHLKVLGE
jgi:hypothetical protein